MNQEQAPTFVVQSSDATTIPVNATPVFDCDSNNLDFVTFVRIVNFLRCGCPSAQIVVRPNLFSQEGARKYYSQLVSFLNMLALHKGEFSALTSHLQDKNYEDFTCWKSGSVITITRHAKT